MATRTATELVTRVRDLTQIKDSGTYRDGFAGDASTDSSLISILSHINAMYAMMCKAGFSQTDHTVSITTSGEASIPAACGRIRSATISGSELVKVEYEEAKRRYDRSGSTASVATPTVYYTVGRKVGVFRRPSSTVTLTLRGDTNPTDLSATTDTPTDLPPRYHEALAIGGAILVSISDLDDATAALRLDRLIPLWEMEVGELGGEINFRALTQRPDRGDV